MNNDQRWIVRSFLNSLVDLKLGYSEPSHRIHYRLLVAEMVLDELPGNDIEELAHRAHADALRDLYLTTDPNRHDRYEKALNALIEIATNGAGT